MESTLKRRTKDYNISKQILLCNIMFALSSTVLLAVSFRPFDNVDTMTTRNTPCEYQLNDGWAVTVTCYTTKIDARHFVFGMFRTWTVYLLL